MAKTKVVANKLRTSLHKLGAFVDIVERQYLGRMQEIVRVTVPKDHLLPDDLPFSISGVPIIFEVAR